MLSKRVAYKLLLVLAIPLVLTWAISLISNSDNLYFSKLVGFIILFIFGTYAVLIIFFKFGRSMKIVSRERSIVKKVLIFSVFFLLLIIIIIGIDKFFEVVFKLGGF